MKTLLSFLFLLATSTNILVLCSDKDEDNLLQGINSYRQTLNVPPLTKNERAQCLADEMADNLDNHPCGSSNYGINLVPGTGPQSTNYPQLLSKCKIHINHTVDGVILPVCVQDLVPTLVLSNYTQKYATYLNDSTYTGVGLGSQDDWMVTVLSTNSPTGDFASGRAGLGFGRPMRMGSLWLVLSMGLLWVV